MPNFNSQTAVEVRAYMRDYILQFYVDEINYSSMPLSRCWFNSSQLVKEVRVVLAFVEHICFQVAGRRCCRNRIVTWWRHQMEIFSALLVICEGNSSVIGEFPSQRPVALSFDVFFDLCLNRRLSKQSRRRWFETPSRPLWRHCNYGVGCVCNLVEDCSNSIANAMELPQSCTKPSAVCLTGKTAILQTIDSLIFLKRKVWTLKEFPSNMWLRWYS